MWTNKQTLCYVINISVCVRSLDRWFNIPRPSACPQPRHSAQRWSNIPPLQATCATSWTAHEPCSPFLGGMERLPCWTGTWKSYDSSTSRIYIEPISKKICQANTTKDPKYPKKTKKCLALHLHLLVRSIESASCTLQSKDPIFIILEATSCCRWNRAG